MSEPFQFAMAGGGTGGHVIPAIAVARVLRERGHEPFFIGTGRGLESKLVPAAGFPLEEIEIGGLKGVGPVRLMRSLAQIPGGVVRVLRYLDRRRPRAVFSMGGYVAGPVMVAARMRRLPVVVMEPNAMPGFTNRRMARFVAKALLSFAEAERYFPRGRTEITGLPVRREFFDIGPKERGAKLTVLITGGSQGSRTLNRAVEESWPLFRQSQFPVRLMHQAGATAYKEVARRFEMAGVEGDVMPFISDMPRAFAEADLIVCRSGAGAVAEVAAAGKAAILVPFPFATDDHQRKNAEALARVGAARLVRDQEMDGRRLFDEITKLAGEPGAMEQMGDAARSFAKPDAAERAATILEELASRF